MPQNKEITGKESYISSMDSNSYAGGIPIGLEIMSRYVAVLINKRNFFDPSDAVVKKAKKLMLETLKQWNDIK